VCEPSEHAVGTLVVLALRCWCVWEKEEEDERPIQSFVGRQR